jgi:hypothetical protein
MTAPRSLPNSCIPQKSTAKEIVERAGAEFLGMKVFTRTALVYFRAPNSAKVLCVAEQDLSVPIVRQKLNGRNS